MKTKHETKLKQLPCVNVNLNVNPIKNKKQIQILKKYVISHSVLTNISYSVTVTIVSYKEFLTIL